MSQGDQNIMDGLAQAARVKGRYARMLPENPTNEEIASAGAFVKDWCRKRKISGGKLATMTGLSHGTISQVISGKYKGDLVSKMRELLAFIDNYEIAKDVVRPEGIVQTRGVKLMWSVIQQTMATKTIGVISAPAGFSKTVVLKAARERITGSILIEIDEKHKTPTGVIRLLASELRCTVGGGSGAQLEAVKRRLRESSRMILVDQAHEMRRDALNVLRSINDLECPVVLAGTKGVHSVVNDIAEGSQIYSRVGMVLPLEEIIMADGGGSGEPIFTVEQVLEICAAGELRFAPDAQEFLHRLAHAQGLGALRTCKLLIRVVAQIPGVRERAITASMLTRAFKQLKGAAYQGFAARSMDEVKVPQKATA